MSAIAEKPSDTLTATVVEVAPRPWLAAGALCWREMVRFFRQRNRVVGAIGQPVIFWLLFGAGLGSSFRMPGDVSGSMSYREYFFPGTIALILLFTAIFATISIIEDRREGFLQSVLVAPIPRWSMVLGKLAGGTLIALVQGLLFLALALTIPLELSLLQVLALAVWMTLVALALTGLGFVLAWRMDSTQGFHAIMSVLLMPMWLLSGAFFPPPQLDSASWMQAALGWVMRANPLTYGVAGLRRLMYWGDADAAAQVGDAPSLGVCLAVTVAFAAVMFALSCRIARQRTQGDLL